MTLILIGKGLVLEGWPSKTGVSWVLGLFQGLFPMMVSSTCLLLWCFYTGTFFFQNRGSSFDRNWKAWAKYSLHIRHAGFSNEILDPMEIPGCRYCLQLVQWAAGGHRIEHIRTREASLLSALLPRWQTQGAGSRNLSVLRVGLYTSTWRRRGEPAHFYRWLSAEAQPGPRC